jgi:formylglycine-generating enzyme
MAEVVGRRSLTLTVEAAMPSGRLCSALLTLAAALSLVELPSAAHANSAPVVTNVTAQQVAGSGLVRVNFDVSDADGDQVFIRVAFCTDLGPGVPCPNLIPVSVTGDVNKEITPGPGKQIIWDAAADYPGRYSSSVTATVYASDAAALGTEMVLVPAGDFVMGSTSGNPDEQPQHTITLNAFYIDKYEVTNAEYARFIDAGGIHIRNYWSANGWDWNRQHWGNISAPDRNRPGYPAWMQWYVAEAYANFAGKRLPTEAEWEKAARGTDGRTYPWGEGIAGNRANYASEAINLIGWYHTPVGFFDGRLFPQPLFQTVDSPGPYGAYDQAGNVLEWTADWYDAAYYAASPPANPAGPPSCPTGNYKVCRGGAWPDAASGLRCSARWIGDTASYLRPDATMAWIGLRCAKSAP